MKISYNWLKDYINTSLPADRVAEILTTIGLEVEGIEASEAVRGGLQGLIVAEVTSCEKHPDADKLSVTTVNTGTEMLQVVCGAPNVRAGQKVILATVGATLYPTGEAEGFKIKKSKIRGLESFGMLCAEDEIGVGNSHDVIIVLPENAKVGTPAIEMFDIESDTLFEIGLTPNRVDAASHYGVARDLAAYLQSNGENIKAQLSDVSTFKAASTNETDVDVIVENHDAAPRYTGVTVSGIKVAASPEWLQKRLRAIGLNPHNNVVDITNFVLHECGQPLHAFDLEKVKGQKIIVKNCAEGTPFKTLDGVERKLSASDLMICNAQQPMCIAGVFGGEESGVSDSTTSVFIESAYFNPVCVRKTAKYHGLSTDASFRYERGADPNIALYALKRCATLICELAGGHVSSPIIDIYPKPILPFNVTVDINRINSLIGKQIDASKIESIIRGLDIEIISKEGTTLQLQVPPYRVDVQREADIVEEVLRIYGFNNIENPQGVKNSITYGNKPTTDKLVNIVSDALTSMGYTEIMSNSLTKASYYEGLTAYTVDSCVRIMNPLSSDLDVMRQTLIFNALEAVQLNMNRRAMDLKFYEIGNCYHFDKNADSQALAAYSQEQRLSITVTGNDTQPSWNSKAIVSDFFTVKTLIERILERVGVSINEGQWEPAVSDLYTEGACYIIRGSKLFEIGVVSKKISAKFDIKQPIYFAEVNIEKLQKLVTTVSVKVSELNKFQPVRRDLALLVDKSVTYAKLREIAIKAEKKLLKAVSLFDVYEGDKLPAGKKSYALGFILEDKEKTLTDKDIERVMSTITSAITHHASAEVRS